MAAPDLPTIERWCQCVLGGAGTPQERAASQTRVLELGSSISNITLIQAVLDGSSDNFAIVVAAQSLLRLVTGAWGARSSVGWRRCTERGAGEREPAGHRALLAGSRVVPLTPPARPAPTHPADHWNSFSEPQHVDIRNYLLNFLANKGPLLQTFAVTSVVQLLCRITKYAWFDEGEPIKQIVAETRKFLGATAKHCAIGMRILLELVNEMNYRNRNRSLTQVRGQQLGGEGGPGKQ